MWARLTEVTGAAAIAVTAVLQAVDGVALKAIVDMWAHASAADRYIMFAAAQAVRQVEIGMDAAFIGEFTPEPPPTSSNGSI